MTKSTSRPVLALEDLEEMEGISLDDMMAGLDEPISSPFAPKAPAPVAEVSLDDDPFTPEEPDVPMTDDLDLMVEPDVAELIPEPVPEPVAEKPKRTRRSSAEVAAEKAAKAPVIAEDDALTVEEPVLVASTEVSSLDDLDAIDSMPDLDAKIAKEVYDRSVAKVTPVAYDPIEALITDVGDVPKWITIVAYGKNGTGKTTFGASGEKTLVVEVEKDGTFSVRDRGSKAKKYPVKTWDDFEKLYWYLKKNPERFNIVCIDTLTRLQELCLRSVILSKKAEGAELLDKDVVKITLSQRGDIGQRMVFWLNAFAELPMHKVWLCQEASGSDDKDVANVDVYPDLQRKIRVYVCSDATVIGRTEIKFKSEIVGGVMKEVPQFIMRTAPSESYLSKDRTKTLGAGLVNPKIDKLVAKVYA